MRLGIIGCGLIGGKRAAASRGTHEISTVFDVDAGRAAALAKRIGAEVARSWHEIATSDLDGVIVATHHDALAEIAAACVENGKHVLVEKPAGKNLGEVQAVAEGARRHSRIVKVGFNHRFHPGLMKAHRLVAEGRIGPLMFIRSRYGHGGRLGYEKEWRCQPEISGGGELIDQGSHLIDLSRWFLGDLGLEYGAATTNFWDIPVDDNCFLALRGTGDTMAWLHASWSEWKNIFSFEIYGRTGKLTVDGLGGSYGTERLTYHRMLPEMGPPETTIWEYPFADQSWQLEMDDFVQAIQARKRPTGDIEDAIAMHRIVQDVYRPESRR